MSVQNYGICCEENYLRFIELVNEQMKSGEWVPIGGVAIEPKTILTPMKYLQAMVRTKKET